MPADSTLTKLESIRTCIGKHRQACQKHGQQMHLCRQAIEAAVADCKIGIVGTETQLKSAWAS